MGYDATNYLPSSIQKKKFVEFIKLLGFEGNSDYYYFYKDEDYKYLYGVGLTISEDNKKLSVHTRTPIFCSAHDLQFQNYTIKQIRQYFGGYFVTDRGTNKYFADKRLDTVPAERGCYAAHFGLSNLYSNIYLLIQNHKEEEGQSKALEYFGIPSSAVLLSNITTTYIASIIENYFRQLYIALLKYSNKKENIIISSKINHYDLFDVSENKIGMEEAVALSKSFQNIHKADSYFREIDKRIDIKGTLSKPYHRRKETLFNTLDRMLEQRHSFVHHLNVDANYNITGLEKDVKTIKVALDMVYAHICEIYNWKHS